MLAFNELGNIGRLGNQMFQYAATRGLAAAKSYEWCIPPFTTHRIDNYSLSNCFTLESVTPNNQYILDRGHAPVVMEKQFHFDEELMQLCPNDVSLYGFFQTWKYFAHIEDEIREDFTFKPEVQKLCKDIWKEIVTDEGYTEAIGLHVRRTDHLIKPTFHPVLPISYYEEALGRLPENIPVFVFTDDPSWAFGHKFFKSDRFFISESDNIHDMCLMSMCDYNIIANSTFSWWGAWLAGHDRVIAPKLWFGPDGEDPTDIYIDRWEYLDV